MKTSLTVEVQRQVSLDTLYRNFETCQSTTGESCSVKKGRTHRKVEFGIYGTEDVSSVISKYLNSLHLFLFRTLTDMSLLIFFFTLQRLNGKVPCVQNVTISKVPWKVVGTKRNGSLRYYVSLILKARSLFFQVGLKKTLF